MGQKLEAVPPFLGGGRVPIKHNVAWAEVYLLTEKWGLLCPFVRGSGVPINTMSPRPRPTSVPSGILIHPAIWNVGHNRHGPKIGGGGAVLLYDGSWVPM